jgi:RNA polymerase sigma factor (sigma-70 family)
MDLNIEQLVKQAQAGSKSALEHIVEQIQSKIHGLALRMLWHPEDARDATQEILIRVITHLGTFKGESKFTTWVYKVAANYLSRVRKSRLEQQQYTFERFGRELDEGPSDAWVESENTLDDVLLLEEIKIGCTLGMLLCMDRPHRLAYILGDILELPGPEAAEILEIKPATFRKRLSRARADIVSFMKMKCGLVNPNNACRCRRRVNHALQMKRVDPDHLLFAHDVDHARQFPKVLNEIRKLEDTQRAVALYRSHPEYAVQENFVGMVKVLINTHHL